MRITICDAIPERGGFVKATVDEMNRRLDDIIRANAKYGKLSFEHGEYSTVYSARAALGNSARTNGYPLRFVVRNAQLYFVRVDM